MYLKGARTQMPNSTLLTVEKSSTRVMWNSVLQTNHTQLWKKQNVNAAHWFRETPPMNNPRAPHLADWRKS